MKKFRFNLEKILQLRKFREDECKIALGQAISILNKIENEIKQTAVRRHAAASQRFINYAEIITWELYIKRLDYQAQKLTEQAAQAEIVVEEKRALYLEASKELKIMEKLKEKQQKTHRKEMFDSQMEELDEITSARTFQNY